MDDKELFIDEKEQEDFKRQSVLMAAINVPEKVNNASKLASYINHDKMALYKMEAKAVDGTREMEYNSFEKNEEIFSEAMFEDDTNQVSAFDLAAEGVLSDEGNEKQRRYVEICKEAEQDVKRLEKKNKQKNSKVLKQTIIDTKDYFPEREVEFESYKSAFSDVKKDTFREEHEYIEQYFMQEEYITGENNGDEDFYITEERDSSEVTEENEEDEVEYAEEQELSEQEGTSEITKEETAEQSKSQKKTTKKKNQKSTKQIGIKTAVSKFMNIRKREEDNVYFKSSGDLTKDGASGVLQSSIDSIKQFSTTIISVIGLFLLALLVSMVLIIMVSAVVVGVISVIGSAVDALQGDSGEVYDADINEEGYVYQSLTDEDIDYIIEVLYDKYEDMSSAQESVLRYTLSKIGCECNPDYHTSLTDDIFDSSSLAYRAYLQIGIDISYDNLYIAAYECYAMEMQNKIVNEELKPGDLIFYGGSDNGRHLGIYHVAIYIGNIDGVDKMVEARGKDWGVVFCDVRTSNVVKVARPY